MEDWKNTKCGTCIIQRQKPICNSCMGHQFYKPMSNADKIRSMSDEELAEFLGRYFTCEYECAAAKDACVCDCNGAIMDWLQSEVKGSE